MMISTNFYLRTLDVVVNVYTFYARHKSEPLGLLMKLLCSMMKEILHTSQIQAMMISTNFYLRTLDVVVNVYTFCAIQNVIVNV